MTAPLPRRRRPAAASRTQRCRAGLLVPALCMLLAFTPHLAQAASPLMEPGEWVLTDKQTLTGTGKYQRALKDLEALRDKARAAAPRGAAPREAAADAASEHRCLSPALARQLTAKGLLERFITGGDREGWQCTWTDKSSDTQSYRIQFHCKNPYSEVSDGLAEMRFDARSFHWELSSETQSPRNGQASARAVVDGRWVAAKCGASAKDFASD